MKDDGRAALYRARLAGAVPFRDLSIRNRWLADVYATIKRSLYRMMEKSERFILKNADIRELSGAPYGKGEPLLRSSRALIAAGFFLPPAEAGEEGCEGRHNFSYPIVRVMTISFVSGIYLAQFFGEPG